MQVCIRICLSTVADRDISELKVNKKDVQGRSTDIFLFCFGIETPEHSRITRKLCRKCFGKVVSLYNFKTLALKSDDYLRAVDADCVVKVEFIPKNEEDVSNVFNDNEYNVSSDEGGQTLLSDCFKDIKDEPEVKLEDIQESAQSEDELVSAVKKVKEEKPNDVAVESKENASDLKRQRGRPLDLIFKSTQKSSKSVQNMKKHAKKHSPTETRPNLLCKFCDKMFSTYGARIKHYKVKHLMTGIKEKCDICQKEVEDMRSHKLINHNPDKLQYPCLICKRRFIQPSLRDSHMRLHTEDRPFECDICQKKFRSALVLNQHKRQIHDKEKSHMCQFCSKGFFKKDKLMNHIRSHTKEKPYKCDVCGKHYSYAGTLKTHKLLHSDERNYACSYCDSRFATKEYLTLHERCHTKEKPYPCKYCGVRFGRSDHRNRHQFTAHEKHLAA